MRSIRNPCIVRLLQRSSGADAGFADGLFPCRGGMEAQIRVKLRALGHQVGLPGGKLLIGVTMSCDVLDRSTRPLASASPNGIAAGRCWAT
jgi:hypothetical protein